MTRTASIPAALGLAACLAAPSARAEPEPPARECGDKAALFATEKGFRVWITRTGVAIDRNPLRPLSRDQIIVLQVVVNGRLASAHGPDYAHLRQGPAPARLEADGLGPVSWRGDVAALPEAIRIVGEDGTPLVDDLRFTECGEPPKVAAPRAPATAAKASTRRNGERSSATRALPLPQGAIR